MSDLKTCTGCGEPRYSTQSRCKACHTKSVADSLERNKHRPCSTCGENTRASGRTQCNPCSTKRRLDHLAAAQNTPCSKCGQHPRGTANTLCNGCSREKMLLRKYGITQSDYDDFLAAQGGGCAICGLTEEKGRSLAVDHCHTTGKVRGILCSDCNTSIGKLGDTAESVQRAVDYLRGTPDV